MGDPNLNGAQENLFGNYIIQRGLANPSLRDEILAQVANQVSSFFSTQCPNKTESFTVLAHFNLVTYFTLFTLYIFSSSPSGVEESEHFELGAWLAPALFLSFCLPALSEADQVLAEVSNTVETLLCKEKQHLYI